MIVLPSGGRPNSYVTREAQEQERLVARIRNDPNFREWMLGQMIHFGAIPRPVTTLREALWRILAAGGSRVAVALGLNPLTISDFLRFRRRGGEVNFSRRVRGLPPLPPRREVRR